MQRIRRFEIETTMAVLGQHYRYPTEPNPPNESGMLLTRTSLALVLRGVVVPATAETPNIHKELLGKWVVKISQHNGRPNKTGIIDLTFTKDSLQVQSDNGKTFIYKYALDTDDIGSIIDVSRQDGKTKTC